MKKGNLCLLFSFILIISGCKIGKLNKERTIEIYAFNDFHGRISENIYENEPGISKLASYLEKQREISDEVVVINSGDYWQDTYESGYNKGKLLTECLDEMKVDAFTLGNHEFDEVIDVN